jgi:hypothetical protein
MVDNFQFYMEYRNSLDNMYNGKYIVIRNRKVVGAFDNEEKAYSEMHKKFKPYTFWVQYCEASIL